VREIAREAARLLAVDSARGHLVEAAMAKHGIPAGDLDAWHATYNAAVAAIIDGQIELSWPDEQPTAEQDGDVRATAACCSAAEMIEHDADCETRDADGSAS
jgi:hypothetical protein